MRKSFFAGLIPLMLFGCTFRKEGTRDQILAMITGLVSVVLAVVTGYLIFGVHIEEGAKVGGMLTGVYTGGTINLAALKTMLSVKDETYIMINSYDILISFLYLTFLLTIGIRLFRKILPHDKSVISRKDMAEIRKEIARNEENPYKGLFTRDGIRHAGTCVGLTLLICAVSAGVALALPSSMFMTVFNLMLTTLGIGASFIRKIHDTPYSYDIGMYCIYIFCIAVASMADLGKLDFAGGIKFDKASADIEASGIYRTVFFEYCDVGSTAADVAVSGYNVLFKGHCGSACAASCDNAFEVVTCGCNYEVACHTGHEVKNGSCVLFSCGFTGDDYCTGVDIFCSESCSCIFAYDNAMYCIFVDGSFIDKRSGINFAFVNNFFVGDFDSGNHIFAGSVFDSESAENYLCSGSTDINTCAEYLLFHTSFSFDFSFYLKC